MAHPDSVALASAVKNVWDSDVAKMVGGVLHNFDTAMSIPNIAAQTVYS